MPRGPHVLWLLGLASAVVASALPGCAGDADDGMPSAAPASLESTSICPTGFLGDRGAAPIVELRSLRADGLDVPLAFGADLAIVTPPQGGRVSFVGVRATNLDGCGVHELPGALHEVL